MITIALLSLALGLFLVHVFLRQARPTNYPPGPRWYPFLGNGYMLRKLTLKLKGQHLALSKLAEDYKTSLLGLRLGGEYVVVGFSPSVVKDILTRDEFNGRPDSFFIKLRCFGKREGVTGCDGVLWQKQRAFVIRNLKGFGAGRTAEDFIYEEVRDLVEVLKRERKPVIIGQLFAPIILSVIWSLVAGRRLSRNDEQLTRLLELLNCRSRAFDMAGGYLNQFPWLRFVAPEKTGFNLLSLLNSELQEFLNGIVEEHKKSYASDVTRDLVDAFLHEKNKNINDHDSVYTDSQLIMILLDLFIASSQTTSSTLEFAFLYMLKYPMIQEKVRLCLNENVGTGDLPRMTDRSKLAYVEAVLAEVQRLCNVVPVCGPRRCLEDTTLNGYFIPKDSTILISLWSVHKDESIFHDPEAFLPERFLDSNGKFFNHNNLLPFGLGKRRCLGEIIAKSCIFLIFSGLMHNFRVSKPSGEPEPSMEPLHGITLAPQQYLAEFIPT